MWIQQPFDNEMKAFIPLGSTGVQISATVDPESDKSRLFRDPFLSNVSLLRRLQLHQERTASILEGITGWGLQIVPGKIEDSFPGVLFIGTFEEPLL
jgi:hypothetical protein